MSLFTSFQLNNLLTSGDSFFASSTADLLYRTVVIASSKISGYMVGNEGFPQHCSGSPSESDPGENTPLLVASGIGKRTIERDRPKDPNSLDLLA